jgi:hypothetical protein
MNDVIRATKYVHREAFSTSLFSDRVEEVFCGIDRFGLYDSRHLLNHARPEYKDLVEAALAEIEMELL